MVNPDISVELPLLFQERCLAVVTRGIGKTALEPNILLDIAIAQDPMAEGWLSCFSQGAQITDSNGQRTVLWTDLALDNDYTFSKHVETHNEEPLTRPTVASEDVIKSYMIEDMRQLITPPEDLGMTILVDYLMRQQEAEDLGLLDVSDDEVLVAIETMDRLIAAHDTK